MQNYGYNPYLQTQMRLTSLKILPVSNIMEANSTPVESFDPMFFYNRAENVIYMKQLNQTGAAPIQTFKLQLPEQSISNGNKPADVNPYEKDFKGLNDRIDVLQKTFDDYIKSQNEEEDIYENKKGSKK